MVTERTIINALIIGASFILVPFVISESLTVDYLPALIVGGLIALGVAFFFFKENLVVCPLVGCYVSGSLNFLPLPLTASQVACILLVLYYITGYVVIKQRKIKVGMPQLFWPIMILTGILLYHNHTLSVAAAGGDTQGAKPALLIYLVVLAYFCGINLPTPSEKVFARIPLYVLIVTVLSSIPYLLSTWIPGLAPYLYVLTDSVNVESYRDSVTGGTGGVMSKLSALGPVGSMLQLYLLANYPIGTWLRPERWWMIIVSLFCAIMVICSGYRSDVFGYLLTIVAGAWCYYSWRAFFIPTGIAVATVLLVIASSNNLINLPLRELPEITQRTLSFIPGDWDPDAIDSGKSSNEFRDNIQDVYIKEYMARSPIIGNGYTIDSKEFKYYNDIMNYGGMLDMNYAVAKTFIEGKMFHTGWISLYDCVGIVGFITFLVLGFNMMVINLRFLFGPRADRRSALYPAYVWLFTNTLTGLVGYFTVFGAFNTEFSGLLVYSIVYSHLVDIMRKTEVPVIPGEIKGHVEMPRISGAYYGRR